MNRRELFASVVAGGALVSLPEASAAPTPIQKLDLLKDYPGLPLALRESPLPGEELLVYGDIDHRPVDGSLQALIVHNWACEDARAGLHIANDVHWPLQFTRPAYLHYHIPIGYTGILVTRWNGEKKRAEVTRMEMFPGDHRPK